ncbi:hypothetical protein [Chryseobacterium capnotolerans]|uniref:hypothetical protein n=1 Tax=Chryseobacterium capnotolerans TaxID=2759528 RepID=UPI001E45B555|nr:hypothetical protein [Chryseobacterium capnotolerans]
MKKYLLLVAISTTFIACQKGGVSQSKMEEAANTIDSTASAASDAIDHASKAANQALDSASIRIKDIEGAKNDIQNKIESTSKMVDSLSDKIASTKLESKIEKRILPPRSLKKLRLMFQLLKLSGKPKSYTKRSLRMIAMN